MSTDPKVLARRFITEFLNTGKPEVLNELCVSGYIDHNLPSGITPRESITFFRAAFPDAHFTVDDIISEGDKVAARYTITATHTGPFFGMPPSGIRVTIGGISIYRVESGRLAEAWVQYDQAGLLQQLQSAPV